MRWEDAVLLTLDIDWAPDFVLEQVIGRVLERGVPATWMVTHRTKLLDLIRETSASELGIHPNFQRGSTHGSSVRQVMTHCLDLVPEASVMRTHSLHQSSGIFAYVVAETGLRCDSSIFLPGAEWIRPVWYDFPAGRQFMRVPYFWEDDTELYKRHPRFTISSIVRGNGLKVLNFHPILVYLNSESSARYQELKRMGTRLPDLRRQDVEHLINHGPGIGTFFDEVLDYLAAKPPVVLSDLISSSAPDSRARG